MRAGTRDVTRVRMTPEEQQTLGLPPHRYIMILETAQSCCGQAKFRDTIFMVNNEASGDLTTGWIPTKFVISEQSEHAVGCPSIRYGTDGFYCEIYLICSLTCVGSLGTRSNYATVPDCSDAVTGMGAYTGIVRSKDLINWTYGAGTFNGEFSETEVCCGESGLSCPIERRKL